MATFSPSPAPRRQTRLQTRNQSPSRRNFSGRVAQTPSQVGNDAASVVSAMDIDERSTITERSHARSGSDTVFSKTDEMSVSFYANLPLEVKQVLRTSDFTKDSYSGEIDTETGFALVGSARTCFVWQHAQAIKGIPTCYIFSCPEDSRLLRPPFHALIPQGPREPGLILVSHTGQIRFWDSIASGLAGGENFTLSHLEDLEADEEVTNLVRADPQTYIISTSYGGLYKLSLTSAGGKYHLASRQFARPYNRTFSRILTSFLNPTPPTAYTKDPTRHVHAVALTPLAPNGDRNAFILANGQLQIWVLKFEGWEDLLSTENLLEAIAPSIQSTFKVTTEDLELSDLAVSGDGTISVLVSYSGEELLHGFRRLYALVELTTDASVYKVKSVRSVPYQTTSQPGPPVHPRIQLLFSGSILSIQFGDAVVVCARGGEYRDRLELKSISDRTLGLGVSSSTNQLLVLTATTMMKVTLDLEKIQAFNAETGRADLIKSIMMQAILYGALSSNPLRFSFPPDLSNEALMQGAEQLSTAVLVSDPEVVKPSPDLSAQMTSRKERLSWLIGFINENSVLEKMTQQSRQQLATDAEKLYSSYQLWLSYNKFLSTSPNRSILKEAVQKYMQDIGEEDHEDVVRAFFRLHVADIGRVLKIVNDIVRAQSQSGDTVAIILPEANRIVITVLNCAYQYREYNRRVYGLSDLMISPWTSRPPVIDTVISLFDLSSAAVENNIDLFKGTKNREPKSQLPELAALFLQTMKERLDWVESLGRDAQGDLTIIQTKFTQIRPEILETLRRSGYSEVAYQLAEHYQDFATLVSLCHRETVYPPDKNPNAERIQVYIQKFKEDFTAELFQWYIQHGEVRTLFEQEAHYSGYIELFFREKPNLGISWIHDLYQQNYNSAATSLLQDAEQATHLDSKHLMLSIGKLACLAESQESNTAVDEQLLDTFHDDLDFVSVHEGLMQELRSALENVRGRQPLDAQIDIIIKAKASSCTDRKAFTHIFKDLLRQLLQGKAISVEDIVDLLTLKDNSSSLEDYATGLHLLNRAQALPEARQQSAIRTVWRRLYLHDDWTAIQRTADVSDDELNKRYQNTALYATLVSVIRREEAVIPPGTALLIPSNEEITSRWPGLSAEQVDSLVEDYISEQDRLGELTLEEIFSRVHELAVEAVQEEEDE